MSEENKEVTTEQTLPNLPETEEKPVESTPAEETKAEEAQAQTEAANAEHAEKVKAAAIDEMEKASQKALDAMREEDNDQSAEIVDEAQVRLDDIFANLQTWMKENANPDKIKAEMEQAGKDVSSLLNDTREKVMDVANSEQFKSTMAAGKDFISGTGSMISDGLKYGYDKLMEVPEFKKVADKVDEGIDELRKNEALKDMVANAEKGVNDFNHAIFSGLRSFFESASAKPEQPAEKPEVKEETEETKEK